MRTARSSSRPGRVSPRHTRDQAHPRDQATPRPGTLPPGPGTFPWTEWQTGVNITLPRTSFVGGNKKAFQWMAYRSLSNRCRQTDWQNDWLTDWQKDTTETLPFRTQLRAVIR